MATPITPSSSICSRPALSCTRCADRKVKCDRQRPCSACVKHNVDCIFKPPQPSRKRHKRVKDHILTDRLRHYEALLQEQGIDLSKLPESPDLEQRPRSPHTSAVAPEVFVPTPSSIETEPSQSANKTQILHGQGRSKIIDNSLWTRIVEEFHDPEDASENSSDDTSEREASDDDFDFVLGSRPKCNTKPRHPAPERIQQLWQIYVENIDPLTKVVHVPTLRPAIQKAADDIAVVPRSFEALMFAIYAAAVMSLSDDECKHRLCEPRKIILSRYISATKAALSRARFMGTTSLVVLQALVLHLLAVRDIYGPRAIWSLTGVVVRIAQSMGFERDGSTLGLPPFETEVRRRIWWLLKTHDTRTAELCGLPKFRDFDPSVEATKWPTNVNDDLLHPGISSLPVEEDKLTDAVFISLRYELTKFAMGRVARLREQGKPLSQWDLRASGSDKVEMAKAFKNLEEILETKYLRYCDPSQPLQLMTMLLGRISMNVTHFLTHHPRSWASIEQTPLSERQWVWGISIKLLEQFNMVQSSPQLKQFAWYASYVLQWHAFIHVLDTLRVNPLTADAEKAWQLIGNTFENNPNIIFDTKKPIHIAVGNLCLKAYSAREVALQNKDMYVPPTPEFILKLCQRREVAKARRQARDKKNNQPKHPVNQLNAHEMAPRPGASVVYSSDNSGSSHIDQSTIAHPPNFTQTGGATGGDPFWFIDEFGNTQGGNFNDLMNVDLDMMLAQDHSVEENGGQPVTWEQWDAWLADSTVYPQYGT